MKQKFRQKFLTEISATFLKMRRFFWFFCKKNPKIAILRFLLLNTEGSEVKIFSFFGMSLVRAQTWWTTLKTCGASAARYGAILQHMEPKITILSHFLWKLVKFTRFQRPTGGRAGVRNFWNSKITLNMLIRGRTIKNNFDRNFWQKFRQHFWKWDKISRFLKIFENWNQDIRILGVVPCAGSNFLARAP